MAWNHGVRSPFPVTNSIGKEREVNIRADAMEDAARLAMGDFVTDDRLDDAAQATVRSFRIALVAGGAFLVAILAIAYL